MTDDASSPGSGESGQAPEDMLGDVWNALDVLPAARSTPNLASSTIEMAAVSVARNGPSTVQLDRTSVADRTRWMAAGVIVAACLAAGFVTGSAGSSGRRSPRGHELMVVVKHLEVLEEAGSLSFLEAFAKGDYTPPMFVGRESPRRGRPDAGPGDAPRGGPPGRDESSGRPQVPTPDLDAAIADFRLAFLEGGEPTPPSLPSELAVSQETVGGEGEPMDGTTDAAFAFELNRLAFGELAPSQRDALIALAEAFADPQRSDLIDAARLWHAWVTFADPVERAGLIELPTNERLEWLERRMRQWRRFMPGRPGEGDRPDGPPGGRSGGGRGPGGPPRRGPDQPPRFGGDSVRHFGTSRDTGDEG